MLDENAEGRSFRDLIIISKRLSKKWFENEMNGDINKNIQEFTVMGSYSFTLYASSNFCVKRILRYSKVFDYMLKFFFKVG